MSYATYAQIADEIPCASRGQVKVKGIPHPIDVCEILPDERKDGAAIVTEMPDDSSLVLDMAHLSQAEQTKFAEMLKTLLSQLPRDSAKAGSDDDAS